MKPRGYSNVSIRTEQYVTIDGIEYMIDYRASAEATYDPGRLYGPPESCYPPEGEMNILAVEIFGITGEDNETVTDDAIRAKVRAAMGDEKMQEALWAAYHDSVADRRMEPDWKDEERMFERKGCR